MPACYDLASSATTVGTDLSGLSLRLRRELDYPGAANFALAAIGRATI